MTFPICDSDFFPLA